MSQTDDKRRRHDRDQKRIKRANMTPMQRADVRRENDRLYRERHREERRRSQRTHRRGGQSSGDSSSS